MPPLPRQSMNTSWWSKSSSYKNKLYIYITMNYILLKAPHCYLQQSHRHTATYFIMEQEKDKVLIVGGTGYMGNRLVYASLDLGHPTFVLYRPENVSDYKKCQMLIEAKMRGAQLLEASMDDHDGLVSVLKQVDVVVCALAGHSLHQQLKLVEAMKEAENIKRFLPTEFGMDSDKMVHAMPPGDIILGEKRKVRRAIEEAGIPHTYVIANCFAGIVLSGFAAIDSFMPPRDHVKVYGDGDKKCIWVDEKDVAMYTMLTASDPRTINKTVHIRPPLNIVSQMEAINVWERLIGKELQKTSIPVDEWLAKRDSGLSFYYQIQVAHVYEIHYLGQLNFPVEGPDGLVTSDLYPDYKYVSVEEYLKRFI